MFIEPQRALLTLMEAQAVPGKHLAGGTLFQRGDQKPPAQYDQAYTVDWNERFQMAAKGNGWQPQTFLAIGMYAADPVSEAKADEKLQNMLIRWNDQGQLVGLLPFLMLLGGLRGESGRQYGFEITPQMPRGALKSPGIFRVAAYVILQVWIKPITIDDIQPL